MTSFNAGVGTSSSRGIASMVASSTFPRTFGRKSELILEA